MSEGKTLKELTVVELKAAAYDQIAQLERTQSILKQINAELLRRQTTEIRPEVTQIGEDKVDSGLQREGSNN